jgi:AcrR family transcriptional regulator
MVEPDNRPAAGDTGSHQLWFTPPVVDQDRRRTLTRERLVAEALSVIAADGVDALSMRALATRLEVVPAALYRHVRNKEQLYDLVLDGVLAEVDDHLDHTLAWTEQINEPPRRRTRRGDSNLFLVDGLRLN